MKLYTIGVTKSNFLLFLYSPENIIKPYIENYLFNCIT